ncbi:MAG TPA: tetratricopeptide repeat protein [Polyangiaceae bacterium]|jgi:tetratricopeptide (TPR) repeat protein
MRSVFFLPVLLSAMLLPLCAFAQADEREEIVTLTEQLRKEPAKVALYLRRGDMYRTIQNWDAAQADYDYARSLDPKIDDIDFLKGRLFLEANWPLSAKIALDRFLATHTNHVDALIARARAQSKLGLRAASAQDYSRALQLAPQSQPELYIERAQTLAGRDSGVGRGVPAEPLVGRDSVEPGAANYANEALQGLDEGIKKLGPLVTLQLAAIDIELGQKRYDAALERVEAAAAASPRKETWLLRKGEILREAGRPAEARAAFHSALQAIETLPPARRNVPAMAALEKRIREQYQAVK